MIGVQNKVDRENTLIIVEKRLTQAMKAIQDLLDASDANLQSRLGLEYRSFDSLQTAIVNNWDAVRRMLKKEGLDV